MSSIHVYDKAKYHHESVMSEGLPDSHASNHVVFFLRWAFTNGLASELFVEECSHLLSPPDGKKIDFMEIYEFWDCCFDSDLLSDLGNEFATHYFCFEKGKYLHDYENTLAGDCPTIFHIEYNEANYAKLKRVISSRFDNWLINRKS